MDTEKIGLVIGFIFAAYSIFIIFYSYFILYLTWIPLWIRYIFDQEHLIRAIHLSFSITILTLLTFRQHASIKGEIILTILSFPTMLAIMIYELNTNLILSLLVFITWILTFPTNLLQRIISMKIIGLIRGIILLTSVPATIYLIMNYEAILYRVVSPTATDMLIGWILLLTLLYATDIKVGWILSALILIFFDYIIYGNYIPPPLGHPPIDITLALGKAWMETEAGIYGLPLGVSAKYIIYFTILGGVLEAVGITKLISNIARSLVGKKPQGIGRATTIFSALMGMVSGSGVAVTTTVGTTMLPAFKKAGYDDVFSAAFTAGTGTAALITPPVLGAAAFIMMEVIGIDYKTLIIMTIFPAIIYYISLQIYLELYTQKIKIIKELDIESPKVQVKLLYLLIPIALLIIMVAYGYTIATSVISATFLSVALGIISKETRPTLVNLLKGFAKGAIDIIPVALATGSAGIVLHALLVTGLGLKMEEVIRFLSGGNFYITLVLLAGFTLLLGMGVPPTASYVIASALVAPSAISLAVKSGFPMEIAKYSIHMFTFYYAVLADVTPPVALAAYAAAALIRRNPIEIGITAAKIALPKYLLGFSFAAAPLGAAILIIPFLNDPLDIILRIIFVVFSIISMNIATVGYLNKNIILWKRILYLILGFMLILPFITLNTIGIIALTVLLFIDIFYKG
ncbi:MAG: TRAP transporter permease [Thermoprotei archaeon]